MNLTQFADKAHISRQNIDRIEKGERCMNADTLAKLCYFHNIASDTILYGTKFDDIRMDKDNKREIAACLDKAKKLLNL